MLACTAQIHTSHPYERKPWTAALQLVVSIKKKHLTSEQRQIGFGALAEGLPTGEVDSIEKQRNANVQSLLRKSKRRTQQRNTRPIFDGIKAVYCEEDIGQTDEKKF